MRTVKLTDEAYEYIVHTLELKAIELEKEADAGRVPPQLFQKVDEYLEQLDKAQQS